jgi:hypothetical protein
MGEGDYFKENLPNHNGGINHFLSSRNYFFMAETCPKNFGTTYSPIGLWHKQTRLNLENIITITKE